MQLNVLKRLGNYLNKLGKLTIYHSFILPNFNSVHFHGTFVVKPIQIKLKKRALRFSCNDYNSTYESLLIVS